MVWTEVQEMQDQIPDTSEDRIGRFIIDAERVVKSKLAAFVEAWTDATEPGIIQVIVKHFALWTEMESLFGSQSEEYHEWVAARKVFPWDLLHQIIDDAKEGLDIDPDFTKKNVEWVRSNTKLYAKIFDLGEVLSQGMHPDDADLRYGEEA